MEIVEMEENGQFRINPIWKTFRKEIQDDIIAELKESAK